MSSTHSQFVILGGGIAGLAAAHRLRESGVEAVIYEAKERPGGLLDNFQVQGFRFDTAVHLSFAEEKPVREVFDRSAYLTHQPEAVNWDSCQWIKHPVQNNMSVLPVEERVELVAGLAEAPTIEIRNYEDWLVSQYGEAIARRWPMKYTEKYWTLPARELGTDWIGQRVRKADLREVLKGAFTDQTENGFYAKEMRYPDEGGYRSFIEPMIRSADIRTGRKAVKIDTGRRQCVVFADGTEVPFGTLISTLPLPVLIMLMNDVPGSVKVAADSLIATQVDLISIGFNRPRVSPTLWFYIYDEDILAARAYAPSWKSPKNAPEGCSSLQFEIYSSRARPQLHTVDQLTANTLLALEKMQLASPEEILFTDHKRLAYGNVIFDLGMEDRRAHVLDFVRSRGIRVAGRFGEWAYLWSNQAMMSGIQAAESALGVQSSSEVGWLEPEAIRVV